MDIPVYYYAVAIVLAILAWLWKRKWELAILIPFLFLIIVETILLRTPSQEARYRLELFWSYSRPWVYNQIIWNIIVFIPVGILLGKLTGWKSILIGFGFSIAIELVQLITHRGLFEFDDILHNTIGTVIGFLICFVLMKVVAKRKAG